MLDRDDNTVTAPDTNPGQSPANTDESVTEGVPMDQMLENAKACDRDGDLLDGENAVTPGADRWSGSGLQRDRHRLPELHRRRMLSLFQRTFFCYNNSKYISVRQEALYGQQLQHGTHRPHPQ